MEFGIFVYKTNKLLYNTCDRFNNNQYSSSGYITINNSSGNNSSIESSNRQGANSINYLDTRGIDYNLFDLQRDSQRKPEKSCENVIICIKNTELKNDSLIDTTEKFLTIQTTPLISIDTNNLFNNKQLTKQLCEIVNVNAIEPMLITDNIETNNDSNCKVKQLCEIVNVNAIEPMLITDNIETNNDSNCEVLHHDHVRDANDFIVHNIYNNNQKAPNHRHDNDDDNIETNNDSNCEVLHHDHVRDANDFIVHNIYNNNQKAPNHRHDNDDLIEKNITRLFNFENRTLNKINLTESETDQLFADYENEISNRDNNNSEKDDYNVSEELILQTIRTEPFSRICPELTEDPFITKVYVLDYDNKILLEELLTHIYKNIKLVKPGENNYEFYYMYQRHEIFKPYHDFNLLDLKTNRLLRSTDFKINIVFIAHYFNSKKKSNITYLIEPLHKLFKMISNNQKIFEFVLLYYYFVLRQAYDKKFFYGPE